MVARRALFALLVLAGCGGQLSIESDAVPQAAAPPDANDASSRGDAWVCEQHDAQRTGRSAARVSRSPSVRWRRTLPASEFVSAVGLVVDEDGNVYAATERGVASFSSDGEERWRAELQQTGPTGASLVLVDDALFVGRGFVVARLSRVTGEVLARRDVGGWIASPVPAPGGLVIAAGTTSGVVAFDRHLEPVWQTDLHGAGTARFDSVFPKGVTLAEDGSVLVASDSITDTDCDASGYLTRYSPEGAHLWTLTAGAGLLPPSATKTGTLWAAATPGEQGPACSRRLPALHRFSLDGKQADGIDLEYIIYDAPVVAPDGSAFVGTAGDLVGIMPGGDIAWRTPKGVGNGTLALAADGVVIAASRATSGVPSSVSGILDGRVLWSISEVSARALAIGPDGTVYAYGSEAQDPVLTAIR